MKEKYEALKMQVIEFKNKQESCDHEWLKPIYTPDLFDGVNKWFTTCKLCGKKLTLFQESDFKLLKTK